MTLAELKRLPGFRAGVLVLLYTVALTVSHWLAYQLRFDFEEKGPQQFALTWAWVVALKIILLGSFGQFSGLLSYFSIPDLKRLFLATAIASGVMLAFRYNADGYALQTLQSRSGTLSEILAIPRGVILIDFFLSLLSVSGIRLFLRVLRERYFTRTSRPSRRARRVGIIGAGDVGANLARELLSKRGLGLHPVAFFDDDRNKWHSRIYDIPVVGPPEALLDHKLNLQLEEVIIAMPTAPAKRMGEVVKILQRGHLKFETVPSVDQLATGQVKVSQLRSVEIQDLLGRDPVELETENINQILHGKVVMVTGAGGSIGSELCRQIASFNPKRLLLVEQCEVQIFQIEQELNDRGFGGIVTAIVADILDIERMRYIFGRYKPEVIFHAAAHKHVPMMESQPGEAIKNNSWGTAQLAELSLESAVERFILISTDKAINPTNVMGASKRFSEIFIQSLHACQPERTKFMAVRFGNVLGSSGSVIPTFNKQIAAGGPVKVTHPDVTRYFMTIPEAVGLVLQSAAQGTGGEIFVLDMGEPVKIVDLARQMIELSGLKPDEDIEIEFVGLRPGEKLFEELSYKGENIADTHHPKVMRFVSEPMPFKQVREALMSLMAEVNTKDPEQLKKMLQQAVPDYDPYLQ